MKSVLLIGLGRFGKHIAIDLHRLGHQVMGVDKSEERVNEMLPFVTNAQIGDSTNSAFLESMGVRNFDVCFVAIGKDFQSSLETTATLKELGAKLVVSRAASTIHSKFLLRNGADEVVYPEKQSARRLAVKLSSDAILDFFELDESYSIYEMAMPRDWVGKSVVQLDVRRKYNINVISIKRDGRVMIPGADTVMSQDDRLYVIGDMKDLRRCFKL